MGKKTKTKKMIFFLATSQYFSLGDNDGKKTAIDTDQLREFILADKYFQPIILLERIQFEK